MFVVCLFLETHRFGDLSVFIKGVVVVRLDDGELVDLDTQCFFKSTLDLDFSAEVNNPVCVFSDEGTTMSLVGLFSQNVLRINVSRRSARGYLVICRQRRVVFVVVVGGDGLHLKLDAEVVTV